MTPTTVEKPNTRSPIRTDKPTPLQRNRKTAEPVRPKRRTTTAKAASPRKGSKTAKILVLLKRPGGAALKELTKASGWQPHSVRGFLSGILGKKMGLKVRSIKGESGERRYSIKP